MIFGIVLLVVGVPIVLWTMRVIERKPVPQPAPAAFEEVGTFNRPVRTRPRRNGPVRFSAPPVTIETIPPVGLVPPIDRSVFVALSTSGSRLARGSTPTYTPVVSDLDDAETLGNRTDADDQLVTRAMSSPYISNRR